MPDGTFYELAYAMNCALHMNWLCNERLSFVKCRKAWIESYGYATLMIVTLLSDSDPSLTLMDDSRGKNRNFSIHKTPATPRARDSGCSFFV